MDEEEYNEFLCSLFGDLLDESGDEHRIQDPFYSSIVEQLRDEEGLRVEGCYRVLKVEIK